MNKERNGISAFMWKQYRNSQLEWWHCSICGHAVQLHSSDHKVGCHKDGCKDDGRVHLCKGKGSGKGHFTI